MVLMNILEMGMSCLSETDCIAIISFLHRYINGSGISLFDIEENLFDYVVSREEELLTVSFSRKLYTTDNITDISLDSCLYLLWAVGNVNSFADRTHSAPTILGIYSPIICFPEQGSCPGKH